MTVGRKILMTPWSATSSAFDDREGFRMPRHMEAKWETPEAAYTYIRIEIEEVSLIRVAVPSK
jgi:hypothetical protein